MASQIAPLGIRQAIVESEKLIQEIEALSRQIEQISKDSRLKNQELLSIASSEVELRKNKKKAQSRRQFLIDNKSDAASEEQSKTLKGVVQEANIRIAALVQKKSDLTLQVETLDSQEQIKTQQRYKLQERLRKAKQKQHLVQQVNQINKKVHLKVQEFKESQAEFSNLYQNASNEKLKQFYFEQLKKIAQEVTRLYQERQTINQAVKKSEHHGIIHLEEGVIDFLVGNFANAQKYYEFCQFQEEKQPDQQETNKKILLNLLQADNNYKHLYGMMEKIRISEQFEQRTRAIRQFEEKQKREEESRIEEQRQEEEKRRLQEQARQRKLQREQKINKFNQQFPKLATIKRQITQSSSIIAQINIKQQQGSTKMKQSFENLQKLISATQSKLSQLDLLMKELQPLAKEVNKQAELYQIQTFKDSTASQLNYSLNSLPEIEQRIKRTSKQQQEEQQRLEKERLAVLQRQLSILPPINLKFYQQDIEKIAHQKQLGPQTLRFLHIQQQYLNQLRVVVELRGVSKEQLSAYQFDVEKYNSLVAKKTAIIEACQFPVQVTEDLLKKQVYQEAMSKLDAIQSQLAPLETIFDQKYIKGLLYKYPEELLKMTKQQIFQQIEQSVIDQYEHELKKAKEETEQLKNLLKQVQAQRNELEKKNKQLEALKEDRLKAYGQEMNKQFFIAAPEQGKILDKVQQQPYYKVAITNQQALRRQYQDFNNDSKLKEVKQKLEEVNRQRERQKQAYENLIKEFTNQRKKTRTTIVRQIYLGDYKQVKDDHKVQRLEAELKDLKQKWLEIMEKKEKKQSRYSQGSQFQIVSRIEEY